MLRKLGFRKWGVTEPLDVSPLSAYQDPGTDEESVEKENTEEERLPEEKGDGEEKSEVETREAEETPNTKSPSEKFGEVDLDETTKKQGIMTDEEFQSIVDQVPKEEENAAGMAEGLDLASKAVESEGPWETMEEQKDEPTRSVGEVESEKKAEPEPEIPVVESEVVKPTDTKTRVARRKLVMKDDPKAKRQKPSRVSHRCLGQWKSKKAGADTASEAVEISSEEDEEVPSRTEEGPPTADHEEAQVEGRKDVPPSPTAQEKVPSSSPAQEETQTEEESLKAQVTESLGQEGPSTQAEESPDREMEEERYQLERKRRGKAPIQKEADRKESPHSQRRSGDQRAISRRHQRQRVLPK